jgi:dolichyl-phosphate-mannose--protein O-mannosyl transferase
MIACSVMAGYVYADKSGAFLVTGTILLIGFGMVVFLLPATFCLTVMLRDGNVLETIMSISRYDILFLCSVVFGIALSIWLLISAQYQPGWEIIQASMSRL